MSRSSNCTLIVVAAHTCKIDTEHWIIWCLRCQIRIISCMTICMRQIRCKYASYICKYFEMSVSNLHCCSMQIEYSLLISSVDQLNACTFNWNVCNHKKYGIVIKTLDMIWLHSALMFQTKYLRVFLLPYLRVRIDFYLKCADEANKLKWNKMEQSQTIKKALAIAGIQILDDEPKIEPRAPCAWFTILEYADSANWLRIINPKMQIINF